VQIGGDPSELQPLTGKQMRQAVRNGGATLVLVNAVPIRLREQAKVFVHVRPGTEDAIVMALADSTNDSLAAQKAGVERARSTPRARRSRTRQGDVVVMFGHELSARHRPSSRSSRRRSPRDGRRILLHPLPFFQQQLSARTTGHDGPPLSPRQILDKAGAEIRALYMAGSFLPEHLKAARTRFHNSIFSWSRSFSRMR
jgi:hypothetical protein